MSKKAISLCLGLYFFYFCLFCVGAQSGGNSASMANRRTAVRYLQLAKQYASEKLWNEASSNAKMGLAYDDGIADLWYIQAVAQMNLGDKKARILPEIVKALTEAEWVDYNRDAARILYADILCGTRQFTQALAVLDSAPFIYSADAEYIRARAYYCLNDIESISKARSRLDAARRVYPADSRFAELFYAFEYQILRRENLVSEEAQTLADAFALMVPLYKNPQEELEIYAAVFSSDSAKKTRMLKAFNSKGRKSPLYAVEALKNGLLSEDAALDYFYQFSDNEVSLSMLEDFTALLKSDDVKQEFSEYLNSYSGTLLIDTDFDLIPNITVSYKRGRPESVSYDSNQDDEYEWSAVCDFGVPVKLSLARNALNLEYSSWPYISAASYKMESLHADLRFVLIAETLSWTSFEVSPDKSIYESIDFDFFIPVLSESEPVSGQDLLRSAMSYSIPSQERDGAVIQVSLLNGVAQIASYSVGDKIYAMAQFEKGIPVSRKLDSDGDGLFETSEYYGFSQDTETQFISTNDEMQIMTNLFGSPVQGTGFYVKKITVDRNGDTIVDFTEEYLPATEGEKIPGKISSWDTDADGEWDVQYVKYPSGSDGKLHEEAKFYQPHTKSLVTVSSVAGIPVAVQYGDETLAVEKGATENFYWIMKRSSQEDEKIIREEINQIAEQGFSLLVEGGKESEKKRFLAVRIEKMIFGMEIPEVKNSGTEE
ncbi:MAG: hypothetical protein IJ207_10430 [Treponema sp.]|uniref:tetratricopeptide repeat protein n=1 Tax=Treponema sp. TaxID=166 RepID=UPI0025F825E8|nr:hypothetical protein [Treponema sp.]MBQ9282591.1 hypothetical protein [Treponema sp.]